MKPMSLLMSTLLLLTSLLSPAFLQAQDGPVPAAPPEGADLPLTDLLYEADFADEDAWSPYESEVLEAEPSADGLQVAHTNPDGGFDFVPPPPDTYAAAYTEFTFTLDTCADGNSALLFSARLADTNDILSADQYVFVLQCNGDYRSRPLANGAPASIDTRGTLSDALEPNTEHVMGILMAANEARWYVDGTEVAAYRTGPTPIEGLMTFGAQRGVAYTVTSWRVWGVDVEALAGDPTEDEALDDPLAARAFGDVLYDPAFEPPTSLTYGLHYPIARYVTPNGLAMFNNDPTAVMLLPEVSGADYYVEMNYFTRVCPDDALTGLVWRADDDLRNFYAFGVTCDGNFRVRPVVDGVAGEVLLEGQLDGPILTSELLSIGVYVQDETVWVYADRELLGTFTDDTHSTGRTGILLQSTIDGQKMDIVVTDIGVLSVE